MPSCEWCGTRASCPECRQAALRGGFAASCAVCDHLGRPCAKHPAPESTAIDPDASPSAPVASPHAPSVSRYAHGCRCAGCRELWRSHRHDQRRAAGVGERRTRTHGKRSTYTAGCRCDACRAAETAHKRAQRARRAAR